MSVARSAGKSRTKDVILLIVLVLVVGGAVAGFGFYHDEVSGYVRLQGWNLGELKGLTQQFLDAMSKDDGERVAGMISPKGPLETVRDPGGKVTALTVFRYGSSTPETLTQLAPSSKAEIGEPTLIFLDGGAVSVFVKYPDAHDLDVRWDRTDQGWKVTGLSRIKAGE